MKKFMNAVVMSSLLATSLVSACCSASAQKVETSTKVFSLKMSASRIIYNPASKGATISVTNPQDYPILVQGKMYAEDKKSPAPFIITPPLFRLEAQQQSRLRIINTSGNFSSNRETMQWLCVAGIPPKDTDVWAGDNHHADEKTKSVQLHMEVSAHECIKVMVRPASVHGTMLEAASALKWQRQGNKLIAKNDSPFYINLKQVSIGGKQIKQLEYVAPFSTQSYALPAGAAGQIQWTVITDEGGDSHLFQSAL